MLKEAKTLASFFISGSLYLWGPVDHLIPIEDWLNASGDSVLIDVRTPSEFRLGHIPGAVNLPLFSDEERARVGTLYKQVSKQAALQEGFTIAGHQLNQYLDALHALLPDPTRSITLYCWRGGKRSEALAWLFAFNGKNVRRIEGGYKSYRRFIHHFFDQNEFTFRILGGSTGAGKTEIIRELSRLGEQVIDLEALAHHKGSAFGAIGESLQPTNEHFENLLFRELFALDPGRPVWLENESRNIGRLYLPEGFWGQMRRSQLYAIEVDESYRLDRIVASYGQTPDKDLLIDAFDRIKKRLGGLAYQQAIDALAQDDLRMAAAIALRYYDKMYDYQLAQWPNELVTHVQGSGDVEEMARRLAAVIGNR